MSARVTIIDYGMGNIWSVRSAFSFLGRDVEITATPSEIECADMLVLPGVGSFRKAMDVIQANRIDEAVREAVIGRGRKIIGICLGMQLLAEHGTEDGASQGLALIPATVERFPTDANLKVPHVGFNRVTPAPASRLFKGLEEGADFYFVHSFYVRSDRLPGSRAMCSYGGDFLAAYEQDNIMAAQFHPEKSQTNGLRLLKNFLAA